MKLKLLSLFFSFSAVCQTPFYSDAIGAQFGRAVSAYGNEALVSNATMTIPFFSPGSVSLYSIENGVADFVENFTPFESNGQGDFGSSVAIQGDHIAIGAPTHNIIGAVFTYRRVNGQWQFVQELMEPDTPGANYFHKVWLHDDYLFVGAFADEADGLPVSTDSGAVYVYKFEGSSWEYVQKLTVSGSRFLGVELRAEGNFMIAQGIDEGQARRFYSFELVGENWEFQAESVPIPTGQSFDLADGMIYTITHNNATQSIHKIDFQNNWASETVATIPPTDQLYNSIEIMGGRMFVGSNGYILLMPRKFPLLYFLMIDDQWTYQDNFYGQGAADNDDYFGMVLSGHGDTLIIGAPVEGMAYHLDVETLSTNDYKTNSSIAYPIPARERLFISITEGIKKASVYSITGSLLAVFKSSDSGFDVQELPRGFYLLTVEYGDGSVMRTKFLKE